MAEHLKGQLRQVRISDKRQITIPSDLFKEMDFGDYAYLECTSDGLLLKPIRIKDGEVLGEQFRRDAEREKVSRFIAAECACFPAIVCAYLFGSFARGDFIAESDIDVRLEYDKTAPFTLFEVAQFQKHLERVTNRSVDVVTAKQLKNPNLAASIEREKVLVYERELSPYVC